MALNLTLESRKYFCKRFLLDYLFRAVCAICLECLIYRYYGQNIRADILLVRDKWSFSLW